jgi:NAD(P)-dependent dehydrogenase (short-subunit alcohol dehydrogenase family)
MMNENKLEGRVAVVTGAGRGIGRAEALALAAEGAKIMVNDAGVSEEGTGASRSPADEACREITAAGGLAVPNYDSVATREGGESIIKAAIEAFGRIDILINNAGILRDRMVFNMNEEEWDSVIKVHLYGTYYCTRPAAVHMRQQRWGRIINTSSIAGLGNMGQSNYSAAKEGIVGFTRSVALDLAKYGVTCNAIRPMAATRGITPELRDAIGKKAAALGITDQAEIDSYFNKLFSSCPEHVAAFAAYLCTEEAGFINGRTFYVNGPDIGLYTEPAVSSRLNRETGCWTMEELVNEVPERLFKQG